MAIARNANSVYVDATGQVTTTGKAVLLKSIVFTSSAAADAITFKDTDTSGTVKFTLKNISATDSKFIDFGSDPIRFPGGIFCSAISASSTAVLVISEVSGGAS